MKVHFEEFGEPDETAIIFVHGAGGSSSTWYMQLRGLSDSLHIVAVDLNGHGKSPDRNEADTMQSYLDDIHSVVTQFKNPILCGHSMGGALTQLYALEHPTLLKGMILVGTGSKLKVLPLIFDLLENDFDSYVEALGTYMFDETTSEKIKSASKAEVRKCKPSIISRDFHACNNFDLMDQVNQIALPTLIIVGETDVMTPLKYSQYMHERIKDSVMRIIPKAGHSVMLEQSEGFNQVVMEWVNSL
ncbi:MAG: alpha/beta fold hydrolase [Candidatus Thorarchaeota archaeon]